MYHCETTRLTAAYGEKVVLKNVSFRAKTGQITVILGGSGCGKSTLLKHLIGLLEPVGGEVRLFGQDLSMATEQELEEIRKRMGMLFQYGALFNSITALENVALPLREHTKLPESICHQVAIAKLALVDLEDAAHLYPPQLSGGMRKRVALARAIALDPELLFCDEPSAGLDPLVAAELDQLLLRLKRLLGMTIVVVTHELASVQTIADHVLMLDQGEVVAEGTLDQLKNHPSPRVRDFLARRIEMQQQTRQTLFDVLVGQ